MHSTPANATTWPQRLARAPRVVAEALEALAEPLASVLRPGPAAPPAAVARALADTLAPGGAADPPPDWLHADQVNAFRLLLHVLRLHGAVLCAEPVGSGKTYLALAVASVLGAGPAVCFVPAALVPQWEATAARLGVDVLVWSQARVSRGRLPCSEADLIIVDESHHFRNPGIRRYRTLAPWLVGRRLLLLSATPVVNAPKDLYHQLHLGLRDDALADDGVPSLRAFAARSRVPRALGRFVIQRLEATEVPPARRTSTIVESGASPLIGRVDSLGLSTQPEVAALVRTVLYRAAASSAAALLSSLRRYRHLLLDARESGAVGGPTLRRDLRHAAMDAEPQLFLWALLAPSSTAGDLRLDDLPALEALIDLARSRADLPDQKSTRLAEVLADAVPTLVFVNARETVTYLRAVLADRWLAWCTGDRAGIGRSTLSRRDVLQWFRPGTGTLAPGLPGRPRTLVTTDVAAEGLDLQSVGRVVHYDLPWTDVRLVQRDGRALRRGSERSLVDVIRFLPGRALESRLRQMELLLRKARLPAELGMGREGRHRWRWRHELADLVPGQGREGRCAVASESGGVLVGVVLERAGAPVAAAMFWREDGADWTEDPGTVESRLLEAARAPAALPPSEVQASNVIRALTPRIRQMLHSASTYRLAGTRPPVCALALGKRLRALAERAARRRDFVQLSDLERALRFVTGGHTAGEVALIEALLAADDSALRAALPTLPDAAAPPAPLQPRVTGLIVFRRRACPAP